MVGLLFCVLFLFHTYPVWPAPKINATKVDTYSDTDSDGKAEINETIEYTITIENTGDGDATDLTIQDILGPNITYTPNSIVVARDDSYEAIGNTLLDISSIDGVLSNDFDPESTALTVIRLNGDINLSGYTTHGGEVEIAADGSFRYLPAAGFRGPADTFAYTCTDGNGNSTDAIVRIDITNMVWYVDNAAPSGDGRSTTPFNTLDHLNGTTADADEPGDYIYISEGSGIYDGGIQLEENQRLIGQGVDLSINGRTLQTASSHPSLSNTAGSIITLANDNEIHGISINSGSSYGIYGESITGSITISNTQILGNHGDGLRLYNLSGITVDIADMLIENNNGNGITLLECTGSAALANITLKGNSGAGLYVDNTLGNGTMDIDMPGIIFDENTGPEFQISGGAPLVDLAGAITNESGYLLNISNTVGGQLNFVFNTINGSGGSGIRVENVASTIVATGLTLSGSSGIDIQTSNGTFSFADAQINNVSGTAFTSNGGTSTITYSGNITNSSGDLITIMDLGTGGVVNFQSGKITAASTSKGITISNSAGSIGFNHYVAGSPANPLGFNAIDLNANTATVNFADANIYTSGAKGIYANGGGLDVTGGAINTTNAMALDIANTGLQMAFSDVHVTNNGSGGITLENTTGTVQMDTLTAITSDTCIKLTNAGEFRVNTGTLTSTAGAATDIDNTLIAMNFTDISSTNSTIQGIDLTNLAMGSAFSVTGNTNITNASSQGIRLDTIGAGTDIAFGNVNINHRNGLGILVKDAQGSIDYGVVVIPNPNGTGGYGIRVENSSAAVIFARADISDTITTIAQTESTGIPTNEGDGDGIFLINNTGSFTINGGTIQNCEGDGLDIRNSSNITIAGVDITNPGNDGIQAINITGSNTVRECTVTGFLGHGNANGFTIYGTAAGTTAITISSSLFSNEDQDGGNAGVFIEGRSTYQVSLTVDDVGGSAFDSIYEKISGSAIVVTAMDSSIVTAYIRDSVFRNAHGVLGNNAIDIGASGNAVAEFIVENNRLENLVHASTFAGTVGFGSLSTAQMTGKIRNNDLDTTRGSAFGSIIGDTGYASSLDATIHNNTADDVARYALRVRLDGSAAGAVRATSNQMGAIIPVGNDSATRDGIEIRSRDDTGDYYASLRENHVIINGSTGKAIDIDSEDNATIHLSATQGNIFQNNGGGPDFDAETEDPGSTICLKLTGHASRTFDLIETAGVFELENLNTINALNPGAIINIGFGIEHTPGCAVHPVEPTDP